MRTIRPGGLLFLLLGAGVWAFLALGTFRGLHDPDSLDYCCIGRNLARGEGFVTDHVQPLSYALWPTLDPGHPDLMRPPLTPLCLAVIFRILGESDAASLALPYLAYLAGLGLFWIYSGKHLAGWLRMAACGLFALNPLLLQHSLIPSSELPFMTLILSVFLWGLDRSRPFRAGALFGLAFLARNNGLVYFAVLLGSWIGTRGGRTAALRAAVGFLAVTAPWLIRNGWLTGNPFYSLHGYIFVEYTRTFPAYSVYETFLHTSAPSLFLAFVLERPLELLEKIQGNLITQLRALAAPAGHIVLAGFLLWPWLKRGEGKRRRDMYLLAGAHLLLMVLASGPEADFQRFLMPFLAPLIVFGLLGLRALAGAAPGGSRKSWAWVLAAGVALQFGSRGGLLLGPKPGLPRDWFRYSAELLGPGEILLTDIPWCTAWYGEVRGLRLPEDWAAVEEHFPSKRIGAIYLSPVLLSQPLRQYWKNIYGGAPPPAGFLLDRTLPDGSKYYRRAG